MTRTGIGRGKLILFGEHAAVYGHPAVGTSLPCQTELIWTPESESPEIQTPDETGIDRDVFLSLIDEISRPEAPDLIGEGGIWRRIGDVPRSGGFGSSAALCVALSRIALNRPGLNYDISVHQLANRLEGLFHGTPSGIDTGMSSDDGTAAWLSSDGSLPRREPIMIPEWNLIYGALPRTGSTAESVRTLRMSVESGNKRVIEAINLLGEIAAVFIETATVRNNNGIEQFSSAAAALVNRAQITLASLGLSTPVLETLLESAIEAGATGGKLSGGGLGGAFYICTQSRASRNRVMEFLSEDLRKKGVELTVPLTALDIGAA
jgi:mevalonate kinase